MLLLTMNMQFSPISKLGYGQYVSIDEEIQFVVHSWCSPINGMKKEQWKGWCASWRWIWFIKDKRHIDKSFCFQPLSLLSMVYEDYLIYQEVYEMHKKDSHLNHLDLFCQHCKNITLGICIKNIVLYHLLSMLVLSC